MDIVSGNSQSGPAGTELPSPLVVRVVNSSGQPLANQIVNFKVKEGGGSIFAGAALTNAQGIAQERWTLGPNPGTAQVLEARAVDPTTGEKRVFATFSATALDPNAMVSSVSVSPTNANVVVGSTQQLSASARGANGTTISGKTFAWKSSNTAVATVSSAGLVTAKAAGTVTITASVEGKSGTASVVVGSAAATDTIPPGTPGTPTFTTSTFSADSFSVTASWGPATDATRYSWKTGSNSGAYNKQGTLTGRTVTFRARTLNDANGYWFCVSGIDAAGNSSEDAACSSYEAPAGAATPPPASTPPPATTVTVATVTVSPTSTSVVAGSTQQLTASARDASGNTVSGKTFSWTSSNTSVATVSSAGLITTKAAGSATITASVDGKSGTATINVTQPTTSSPPPSTTTGVWYEQNWQSLTSLPSNGSASGIHYATRATIQSGTLFDGSTGKFVRAQYPGGGVEGTAQVALRPDAASKDRPREIWGELYVRVPSDWSIKSDDKTFFHMEDWSNVKSGSGAGQSEVWRWAIYLRNGSPYGGPYYRLETFENFGSMHTSIFNGQWFRLRYHFKMASNTTATDGIYEVWINDRKVTSRVGIRTDSAPEAYFGSITLGANADPMGSGSRDWGRVRLYTSNPGW